MYLKNTYHIHYIVTAIAVTMFFSCKDNFKDVQQMGISENEPIGVSENINLKYTDSGRIKAILVSPKMLDYSNREFAFNEFPEGIVLDVFDEEQNMTNIIADYAISYEKTNLIDLQGNVRIATYNKDTLLAEQLYYDQDKEWVFTDRPVSLKQGFDELHGIGFDSDTKFRKTKLLEPTGPISVQE